MNKEEIHCLFLRGLLMCVISSRASASGSIGSGSILGSARSKPFEMVPVLPFLALGIIRQAFGHVCRVV